MTFDITLVNTTALWWDALFVWPRLDVEPVRVVAHTTAFELQHTHRPRRCHRLTDSFTPRSTQNRSFRRRIPMPISRLGVEKTKPNTTKVCIHQSKEMYYNTK